MTLFNFPKSNLLFKTLCLCIALTTVPFYLTAQQVSINTDGADPDASAVLDLVATDKGLLVPRMSSAERAAIANPAKGLLVFDNGTKTFWFFNGGVWRNFEAALPDRIVDGNFDTSVKVNENGGDNTIYFSNDGVETWRITETALEPLNNGNSVFIGEGAGLNDDRVDNRNVFIGKDAGKTNGSGHSNLAIGYKSLEINGIGNENTALGDNTLAKNNSGHANTATGAYALDANTEVGTFAVGNEPLTKRFKLAIKILLEGPENGGIMKDDLRALVAFPLSEPFADLGYTHVKYGGNETTAANQLHDFGDNTNIVDWVFVALRDKNDNTQVLATKSLFVRKDGQLVDIEGGSTFFIHALPDDDYYIAIRHRNHFGICSLTTFTLNNSTQ